MLELRDYQEEALEAVEDAEREGTRRPLVVHPTGTGKTVTFGAAAARRCNVKAAAVLERHRIGIIVHRDELAQQTIEKLGWQAPELSTGLVKGSVNEVGADVVIMSVQTAHRDNRLAELKEAQRKYGPFGTLIVDEGHHLPAPTWTKLVTGLGGFSAAGPLTIGFTATPERDNGKTLGGWEKVVSYMSIREAIHKGYLVPILPAEVIETKVDLDKVGRSGGDFSGGGLGQALEETGAIAQIADAYLEKAKDRKGVAFTPTVRTAYQLAEALNARGIPAEALDGELDTDHRRAVLRRLKTGETQVVTNCGVLTEGFDEPSVSCVVIARPTKFHGLYVQMVGRGTRLYPGKKDLLILDVVGATRRHELVGLVDLGLDMDGGRDKKEPGERQKCPTCGEEDCQDVDHRCRLCHRYLPQSVTADGGFRHENCQATGSGQQDVFGSSRLRWLPLPGGAQCLGAGRETVIMVPSGFDTWKVISYAEGKAKVLHDQIPADWAMGIGEDRSKAFVKLVERSAGWLRMRVTDPQKSALVREGLPERNLVHVKTRGEAADLLTRIQGKRALIKLGLIQRG